MTLEPDSLQRPVHPVGADVRGAIDAIHNPLRLIDVRTARGLELAMLMADMLCASGTAVTGRPWSSKAWTLIVANTLHLLATAPAGKEMTLSDVAARLTLSPAAAEAVYQAMLDRGLAVHDGVATFLTVAGRQMLVRKVSERQTFEREALARLADWMPAIAP